MNSTPKTKPLLLRYGFFIEQIEQKFPVFGQCLQPLMKVVTMFLAAPSDSRLRISVRGQIRSPHLLDDFLGFGQLTVYRLMRNLDPEDPKLQKLRERDIGDTDAEFSRLQAKFAKKEFWHGQQIVQIAERAGVRDLYEMFYKATSGIVHGSSYPLLRRDRRGKWRIARDTKHWHRYVADSIVFGYLLLGVLFSEAFDVRATSPW